MLKRAKSSTVQARIRVTEYVASTNICARDPLSLATMTISSKPQKYRVDAGTNFNNVEDGRTQFQVETSPRPAAHMASSSGDSGRVQSRIQFGHKLLFSLCVPVKLLLLG